MSDPDVMSAMYEDLEPEGTARAFTVLEMQQGMYGDGSALDLAKTMRQGLATASDDPSFSGESYANELMQLFIAPMHTDEQRDWASDNQLSSSAGASLMAFLMKDVNYSPEFLTGAADKLDEFEQLAQDGPMGDARSWYSHTGHSPFNESEGAEQADPMAEMMRALSRQPDVGMQFFESEDRRNLYFNDRDWSYDGYDGIAAVADSVSTDADNLQKNPELATMIAAQFVDETANSPGFNPEDAKRASDSVSHLLSFYMPSVAATMDADGSLDEGARTTDHITVTGMGTTGVMPVFYREDLAQMTKVAMSTEDGLTTMAEGVGGYTGERMTGLASEYSEDPSNDTVRNQLRGALMDDAELQGFMERMAGETQIDEAVSRDKQRQFWINAVSEVAGAVPIPGSNAAGEALGEWGSKGVEYAWNAGSEAILDQAGSSLADTAGEARDNAEGAAQARVPVISITGFHTLVDSGAIPRDQVPDSWYADGDLRPVTDILGEDDQAAYLTDATAGMSGIISEEDLENTYSRTFQNYYEEPESAK